jgi:hypothetical protein
MTNDISCWICRRTKQELFKEIDDYLGDDAFRGSDLTKDDSGIKINICIVCNEYFGNEIMKWQNEVYLPELEEEISTLKVLIEKLESWVGSIDNEIENILDKTGIESIM